MSLPVFPLLRAPDANHHLRRFKPGRWSLCVGLNRQRHLAKSFRSKTVLKGARFQARMTLAGTRKPGRRRDPRTRDAGHGCEGLIAARVSDSGLGKVRFA